MAERQPCRAATLTLGKHLNMMRLTSHFNTAGEIAMGFKLLAIALVFASLALGADMAPLGTYTARERSRLAFVKRAAPTLPTFANAADQAWARQPIDAFIFHRLQKE